MGFTLILSTLLLLVLQKTTLCDKLCRGGLVYLGNLNESFPEFVHLNNVYKQQQYKHNNASVYKHTEQHMYIYYQSPRWHVGPEVGNPSKSILSVVSRRSSPALIRRRYWQIKVKRSRWQNLPDVKCICARFNMQRCTSGLLQFRGLRKTNPQSIVMGDYYLTGQTHDKRPIYKQHKGDMYLYHNMGIWWVGSGVGSSAKMFVKDSAFRPEQIVNHWNVYQTMNRFNPARMSLAMVTRKRVKLFCSGVKSRGDMKYECNTDVCANNAPCQQRDKQVFCQCTKGYFGPVCEQDTDCGKPIRTEGVSLVTSSGRSVTDLSFYRCKTNNKVTIAMCGAHKTWNFINTC